MPPKRRTAGPATKSQQATLAFHGASNKVTKAGARVHDTKKGLSDKVAVRRSSDLNIIELKDDTDEGRGDVAADTIDASIVEQTVKKVEAPQMEVSPEEEEAMSISDATIKKYWAAKEKERMAPRVHQQDLSLHDKILREFDMSGHYGPCTGITRMKRWKRAHRLDLNPPIEVLAVLLKETEGKENNAAVQRSRVDELLSSKVESDTS